MVDERQNRPTARSSALRNEGLHIRTFDDLVEDYNRALFSSEEDVGGDVGVAAGEWGTDARGHDGTDQSSGDLDDPGDEETRQNEVLQAEEAAMGLLARAMMEHVSSEATMRVVLDDCLNVRCCELTENTTGGVPDGESMVSVAEVAEPSVENTFDQHRQNLNAQGRSEREDGGCKGTICSPADASLDEEATQRATDSRENRRTFCARCAERLQKAAVGTVLEEGRNHPDETTRLVHDIMSAVTTGCWEAVERIAMDHCCLPPHESKPPMQRVVEPSGSGNEAQDDVNSDSSVGVPGTDSSGGGPKQREHCNPANVASSSWTPCGIELIVSFRVPGSMCNILHLCAAMGHHAVAVGVANTLKAFVVVNGELDEGESRAQRHIGQLLAEGDRGGNTPILLAVCSGHPAMVKLLLSLWREVAAQGEQLSGICRAALCRWDGFTLLHGIAVLDWTVDRDVVTEVINVVSSDSFIRNHVVNNNNNNGKDSLVPTSLRLAAVLGNYKLVDFLVRTGLGRDHSSCRGAWEAEIKYLRHYATSVLATSEGLQLLAALGDTVRL